MDEMLKMCDIDMLKYDAPTVEPLALWLASIAFDAFIIKPKVLCSQEGGVILSITNSEVIGDIELYNDGTILTATCANHGNVEILNWTEETIHDAVKYLEKFRAEVRLNP